jgi:hypothetical protein
MKRSDERILTTLVGSLPRDRRLADLLIADAIEALLTRPFRGEAE